MKKKNKLEKYFQKEKSTFDLENHKLYITLDLLFQNYTMEFNSCLISML